MSKERTDVSNFRMKLIGKNIFYLTYLDGADVDLEMIKEVVKNGFEVHGTEPFYSIIDLRDNFASMSAEAKKYLADQELLNKLRICEAVMVNTLAMKLIISGYYRLYKPTWPIKAMRKNTELYNWLEQHQVNSDDLEDLKDFFAQKEAQVTD